MTTHEYPRGAGLRATQTFPVPQRVGIIFFRNLARAARSFFGEIGERVFFLGEVVRSLGEPRTYLPEIVRHMKSIGVDSVPLAAIVAAFIGAVTAYQTRFQLFPGATLSAVALILRQSVVLELGPLLTALVLAGRVGARMTAEIGTMRVTEQIDALETLAYDPIAYLVVPRVIAAMVMLPFLVIVANAVGVAAGFAVGVLATDMTVNDFTTGLRIGFSFFQVIYPLIKAVLFGGATALVCSYEGYVTGAGAEGVGSSTARAVVITSVVLLLLDTLTALYLAQYTT